MVKVGRAAGGVSLNGLEYLLNEEGEEIAFDTIGEAKDYLRSFGMSEEEIEECVFERIPQPETCLFGHSICCYPIDECKDCPNRQ